MRYIHLFSYFCWSLFFSPEILICWIAYLIVFLYIYIVLFCDPICLFSFSMPGSRKGSCDHRLPHWDKHDWYFHCWKCMQAQPCSTCVHWEPSLWTCRSLQMLAFDSANDPISLSADVGLSINSDAYVFWRLTTSLQPKFYARRHFWFWSYREGSFAEDHIFYLLLQCCTSILIKYYDKTATFVIFY